MVCWFKRQARPPATSIGPDQGWKVGPPHESGWVVQEFQVIGNIGVSMGSTQEYMTAHAALAQNIQKMLSLLSPEVTL